MNESLEHPFTSFGPPPYRFVGMTEKVYQAHPGAPVQPGATCAHCGAAIRHVCMISCGDGSEHGVGTTCVLKVAQEPKLVDDVKRAKRKHDAALRAKRDARTKAELEERLEALRPILAVKPHPKLEGKTLADYIDFCVEYAGGQTQRELLQELAVYA